MTADSRIGLKLLGQFPYKQVFFFISSTEREPNGRELGLGLQGMGVITDRCEEDENIRPGDLPLTAVRIRKPSAACAHMGY